jgi:replication factor C large subunit
MMIKDEKSAPLVAALLALEPEEIAFLTESKSATKKIQKIYEEAGALREADVEHEVEVFGGFGKKSLEAGVAEEEPEMEETDLMKVKKEEKKEVKSQSSLFDF